MKPVANEAEGLWDELSLIEDWMRGGLRRDRPRPDFAAITAATSIAAAANRATSGADGRAVVPPAGSAEAVAILLTMARDVEACTACRLSAGRKRSVFGTGVTSPIVLVVGEGPGGEEDASGLPFVGPAGKLLDRMLAAIGVSRETNAYIANIVKCRPPGNRLPAPDETKACMPWLERQIELLAPRAILALGNTATQALTGSSEGITRQRGRWFEYRGIPLIATFHPSAILRDDSHRRPAWEDLKMLREKLGDVLLP